MLKQNIKILVNIFLKIEWLVKLEIDQKLTKIEVWKVKIYQQQVIYNSTTEISQFYLSLNLFVWFLPFYFTGVAYTTD